MVLGAFVLVGQAVIAYLLLELVFRQVDLAPDGLVERLRRCGLLYAGAALTAGLGGGWVQFRLAGPAGLGLAALNWVPWWLLWRFGLRKQLAFLFKDDGGRPVNSTKPDQ